MLRAVLKAAGQATAFPGFGRESIPHHAHLPAGDGRWRLLVDAEARFAVPRDVSTAIIMAAAIRKRISFMCF